MKKIAFFPIFILTGFFASSQKKGLAISGAARFPIGEFSSTHWIGISAEISPALHQFDSTGLKKISFTYKGGITCYAGKKETIYGYPNQYGLYTLINGLAGISFKPARKVNTMLFAGPALALYNGTTRFTLVAELEAGYHLPGEICLGPSLILMKENGADALWAAGVKCSIRL